MDSPHHTLDNRFVAAYSHRSLNYNWVAVFYYFNDQDVTPCIHNLGISRRVRWSVYVKPMEPVPSTSDNRLEEFRVTVDGGTTWYSTGSLFNGQDITLETSRSIQSRWNLERALERLRVSPMEEHDF